MNPQRQELEQLQAAIQAIQASGLTEKTIGDRTFKYQDLQTLIAREKQLKLELALSERGVQRNIKVRFARD